MTQVVGILGGMGPAAGADFVRLFVDACARRMRARGETVRDQGFPEHWLAQVPVPDRSGALESEDLGAHQPLEPMLQALGRLAALGSRAVAIACNTAHAWHATLQERFPQVEVLHVAREVSAHLASQGIRDVALMATRGHLPHRSVRAGDGGRRHGLSPAACRGTAHAHAWHLRRRESGRHAVGAGLLQRGGAATRTASWIGGHRHGMHRDSSRTGGLGGGRWAESRRSGPGSRVRACCAGVRRACLTRLIR